MSKPEGISQEVWKAAESTLDTMLSNAGYEGWRADSIATIAKAILAAKEEERGVCAQTAATYGANMSIWLSSEWPTAKLASNYAGQDIAAAIRKRGEA